MEHFDRHGQVEPKGLSVLRFLHLPFANIEVDIVVILVHLYDHSSKYLTCK